MGVCAECGKEGALKKVLPMQIAPHYLLLDGMPKGGLIQA